MVYCKNTYVKSYRYSSACFPCHEAYVESKYNYDDYETIDMIGSFRLKKVIHVTYQNGVLHLEQYMLDRLCQKVQLCIYS